METGNFAVDVLKALAYLAALPFIELWDRLRTGCVSHQWKLEVETAYGTQMHRCERCSTEKWRRKD